MAQSAVDLVDKELAGMLPFALIASLLIEWDHRTGHLSCAGRSGRVHGLCECAGFAAQLDPCAFDDRAVTAKPNVRTPRLGSVDVTIVVAARYFSIDLGLLSAGLFLAFRQRGVGSLESSLGPLHCFQTPCDRVPTFLDTIAGSQVQAPVAFTDLVLPGLKLLVSSVGAGIADIGHVIPLVSGLVPLIRLTFPFVGEVIPVIGGRASIIHRSLVPLVVNTVPAGILRVYQTHASTLGHAARSSSPETRKDFHVVALQPPAPQASSAATAWR